MKSFNVEIVVLRSTFKIIKHLNLFHPLNTQVSNCFMRQYIFYVKCQNVWSANSQYVTTHIWRKCALDVNNVFVFSSPPPVTTVQDLVLKTSYVWKNRMINWLLQIKFEKRYNNFHLWQQSMTSCGNTTHSRDSFSML